MQNSQEKIFLDSEGDAWFKRNQEWLNNYQADQDPVIKVLQEFKLKPGKVLEIGASNGSRLHWMAEEWKCQGVAVEPSAQAIEYGEKHFSEIKFIQAVADNIPLDDSFQLVIVNFVLHWLDRKNLLKSIAEIDRLLDDGGYLLLGDFLPYKPTRVPYHHLKDQGVYTFKQDYSQLFLASSLYKLVYLKEAHAFSNELYQFPDEFDSHGIWLMRKSLDGYYA